MNYRTTHVITERFEEINSSLVIGIIDMINVLCNFFRITAFNTFRCNSVAFSKQDNIAEIKTPNDNITDKVAIHKTIVLASRSQRFAGAFLDGVIQFIVTLLFLKFIGLYGYIFDHQDLTIGKSLFRFIIGSSIFLIINGYFLSKHGQTIGKKFIGTRIVSRINYRVLPLKKIFILRFLPILLVIQIPIIGILLSFVDVLFIFKKDKCCIHDLIAGTIVVKIKS